MVVIAGNAVTDTRPGPEKRQRLGLWIGAHARGTCLEDNDITGNAEADMVREADPPSAG